MAGPSQPPLPDLIASFTARAARWPASPRGAHELGASSGEIAAVLERAVASRCTSPSSTTFRCTPPLATRLAALPYLHLFPGASAALNRQHREWDEARRQRAREVRGRSSRTGAVGSEAAIDDIAG